jgi:hydrogenase maturation factor
MATKQKLLVKHKLIAKELFLKYAMPCLVERIRRGEISEEEFEKLCEDLVENKPIPDEKMHTLFPVAMNFIKDSAEKKKKFDGKTAKIDKEVVRQYFWYDHDEVVRTRMNPSRAKYCYVLPGKVKQVKDNIALVQTPFDEREVNISFLGKKDILKKNVTVHYYHACEIISDEEAKELWVLKSE